MVHYEGHPNPPSQHKVVAVSHRIGLYRTFQNYSTNINTDFCVFCLNWRNSNMTTAVSGGRGKGWGGRVGACTPLIICNPCRVFTRLPATKFPLFVTTGDAMAACFCCLIFLPIWGPVRTWARTEASEHAAPISWPWNYRIRVSVCSFWVYPPW